MRQQAPCSVVVLMIERCGSRGRRVGAGFEFDCGAQLGDGGDLSQLDVVRIAALAAAGGDDADLIQRESTLAHLRGAERKLLEPVGDGRDGGRVGRRYAGFPRDQRRHRPRPGDPDQLVAIHFGGDLHDARVDGVALTGQLGQLAEQHLKTILRAHTHRIRRGE